ncbi:MAG: hypothetical protein AUK35_05695 [Zetaproteobacteria bacterium CG2_30_46_52]|nr:MAG: hypothetical protein AUK35_05695 [Zetaproteobacteria bacterium CG2_30_46_52]
MTSLLPIKLILTSVGHAKEAHTLAEGLVASSLAACVQISNQGQSVYRWQGKVVSDDEYYLSIKTDSEHAQEVVNWLKSHHSYDVPEIIVVDAMADHAYGQWLQHELNQ